MNEKTLFEIRDIHENIFQIKKCTHCGNIFTWFDKDIDINPYYDTLDYSIKDTRKTVFHHIQRLEYNRVLNKISGILKTKKIELLDFGCGKGVFLSFAKEKGFLVKGVETSLPRARYAEEHFNIVVSTSHYHSGTIFNAKFDVITIFHVAEHLTHPVELISTLVKENLKKGGLLIIEVPNFSSWQSKWSGERWMQLDVPRHLSHFTPEILSGIVNSSECRITGHQFFSFHLGIMGMVQTMMTWFGYKNFLMNDLKHNSSWKLLSIIAILLPFATTAEIIASLFAKGGIIRYYAVKES